MNALANTRGALAHFLRSLSADPVEARRLLHWALGIGRAQLLLRRCSTGHRVYVQGPLHCDVDGDVTIGDNVCFFGGMLASELRCHAGAHLAIGADSVFNYGFSIEARQSVRIGRRCMIASQVRICDSGRDGAAPVVIGDDVWIAHGAIIEPGVELGAGAVVSAGSVVTASVPPAHLAIGNPARVLRLEALGRSS